jgi:hypothetical protein
MIAAALIFVSSGVSFAHDWNDRNHKPPGKAYGHYKVQKHHPGWNYKNFKRNSHYNKRYVYKKVRDRRYYDDHYRRPAPRRNVIYRVAKKDPFVVFKIIVKDRR